VDPAFIEPDLLVYTLRNVLPVVTYIYQGHIAQLAYCIDKPGKKLLLVSVKPLRGLIQDKQGRIFYKGPGQQAETLYVGWDQAE